MVNFFKKEKRIISFANLVLAILYIYICMYKSVSIKKKVCNDKLFRRITKNLPQLIRHTDNKYHAWFDANLKISEKTHQYTN